MKTTTSTAYTPLTGEGCSCRPGIQRGHPGEVNTYTLYRPQGVAITVTARALSAFALLACLALPAHAEPCKVNVLTCGPAVGSVGAGRISAAHPADLAALKGPKAAAAKN